VEKEVAARLTRNCLVVVVDFFVAGSTWVNWRGVWILRIMNQSLIMRINLPKSKIEILYFVVKNEKQYQISF